MKKLLALLLIAASLLGLCSCAASGPSALRVGYTIQNDDNHEYYFMDRENVLTSSDLATTQSELDRAGAWLTENILKSSETGKCAFDFKIGEQSFAETVKDWTVKTELTGETDDAATYQLTYTRAEKPIRVTVTATLYKAYAVAEYVVWLTNDSSSDSETVSSLYGIDAVFAADNSRADGSVDLTSFKGGVDEASSFEPTTITLANDKSKSYANAGGRSTAFGAPYVNAAWESREAAWGREGVFFSVGWSGQWQIDCKNTGEGLRFQGKQQKFSSPLHAGESVRTPLVTLLFWEKDFMRSQNLWRRWLYNVAMIRPSGEPAQPLIYGNAGPSNDLLGTRTRESQLSAQQRWKDLGFDIDAWQIDAGWYPLVIQGEWSSTGNWYADPETFGENLSEIGKSAAANGWKFILWYEPERMVTNSDWEKQFRDTDWIFTGVGGTRVLNLSKDEVTDFLIAFMKESLGENAVDIYRMDCNIVAPSLRDYWNDFDEEGRTGMTENHYVVNLLRFYDAIIDFLGPENFIDNCASGGKRMDLEIYRRTLTLWRDDACYAPIVTQCHSWSYNFLFPYSGQGTIQSNYKKIPYDFRSNLMTSMVCVWDSKLMASDVRIEQAYKNCIREFRSYAGYLTGDYYPLLPFTSDQQAWLGYSFVNYEGTEGLIQLFRRYSTVDEQHVFLSGLVAEKTYVVRDIDTDLELHATGAQLMRDGITVGANESNTALILTVTAED